MILKLTVHAAPLSFRQLSDMISSCAFQKKKLAIEIRTCLSALLSCNFRSRIYTKNDHLREFMRKHYHDN